MGIRPWAVSHPGPPRLCHVGICFHVFAPRSNAASLRRRVPSAAARRVPRRARPVPAVTLPALRAATAALRAGASTSAGSPSAFATAGCAATRLATTASFTAHVDSSLPSGTRPTPTDALTCRQDGAASRDGHRGIRDLRTPSEAVAIPNDHPRQRRAWLRSVHTSSTAVAESSRCSGTSRALPRLRMPTAAAARFPIQPPARTIRSSSIECGPLDKSVAKRWSRLRLKLVSVPMANCGG